MIVKNADTTRLSLKYLNNLYPRKSSISMVLALFFSKSPFSKISVTFAFTSKSGATGCKKWRQIWLNIQMLNLPCNLKSWYMLFFYNCPFLYSYYHNTYIWNIMYVPWYFYNRFAQKWRKQPWWYHVRNISKACTFLLFFLMLHVYLITYSHKELHFIIMP